MGFVRVYEQEAAQANAQIDSAIGKLNNLLGNQNNSNCMLSEKVDVLSSLISPALTSIGGKK